MSSLHDIFSSKPSSHSDLSHVIVDFRERNSLVYSYLKGFGVPCSFSSLQVGDYVVGGLVIERKSAKDFFSSIINKRLFIQLKSLSCLKCKLLIIEGSLNDFSLNKISLIRGVILSVILDFNVQIIFSSSESDTACILRSLAKKFSKVSSPHPINPRKIPSSFFDKKLFVLESFPGVGPVISRSLINNFGFLNKVFSSSKDSLLSIKGFSPKKIDDFLFLLNN